MSLFGYPVSMRRCFIIHRTAATRAKCPRCQTKATSAVTPITVAPPPNVDPAKALPTRVLRQRMEEHHRVDENGERGAFYGTMDRLRHEGGSAWAIRHANGNLKQVNHFRGDRLHRVDGPAVILYREDGSIEEEQHFYGGKRHRDDGFATIVYHEDGTVKKKTCSRNNKQVSQRELLRRYITKLYPEISQSNDAAFEWLEPHFEEDPKTHAFIPPDPNLVATALHMFENPAPSQA